MRITAIRKASYAATRVVQNASKAAATTTGGGGAVGTSIQRKELEFPRAVSREEAPYIQPAKETSKESLMPWRGWIERLLRDKMSPEKFDAAKGYFYFWPEDPNNLHQVPYPDTRTIVSKDGKESASYHMQDPNDPEVQEAKKQLAIGPASSPGNKSQFATGPSDFDPTGLRAVMAVNNEELFKSLDKHMPDHLPTPTWQAHEEELFKWYKDRGLPVPIGGNVNLVSTKRRIAMW
ncbi:hypothetical protein FRACYDRAFT_217468 [Fragilariopsis cylindrus CCMP1102]|uniref:Uncharacterized protein n=1 Tax=Fragilariopsis cylindrus CCMP1102 TaxID=635003 RepID=A0A1E7FG35_9STRA|nr:hypothetical protein FRACYDRAFT_217468 [Fragilariopsis cylindrus CCMP1102]|eukprot:OEU17106.1 hypothetical protein FRACYDRAFT_217468 [Fragilariopsis cylindrus CCMP1102]